MITVDDIVRLAVPDPDGDPGYLIGTVEVLGALCHLEAIRVEWRDGCQVAWRPDGRKDEETYNVARLEELDAMAQPDSPYATSEIEGYEGEYVVRLFPFCQ